MKTGLVLVATFLISAAAHANVTCGGTYKDELGQAGKVIVTTNADSTTLSVSYLTATETPDISNTIQLNVTKVNPLFPVYTIEAQQDLRDRDGDLTEVVLNIQSETLPQTPTGRPSKMTITYTSARAVHVNSQTYTLGCTITQ